MPRHLEPDRGVRHVPLQQQHRPTDRISLVEQVEEDRRAEVIRQVPAHHHALSRALRDGAQIEALRVRLRDLHFGKLRAQDRHQLAIALDGDHLRSGRRQRPGEMSETGAQLHHPIAATDPGQRRQRPQKPLVAEEVLPPGLLRPEPVPPQELRGLHSRHPGSADIAGSARSPRNSRCAPAMAIIAALSVQRRGSGRCSAIPSAAQRSFANARSRELAATPPQITIVSSLAARAARTARWVSASQTASWNEAHRSDSACPEGTPCSRTWLSTAVLSPLNEKSNAARERRDSPRGKSIAAGLPVRASRSTWAPPGYGSPSSFATLSNASPAASSSVFPSARYSPSERTSYSEVCPPETTRASQGGAGAGSASSTASRCPSR